MKALSLDRAPRADGRPARHRHLMPGNSPGRTSPARSRDSSVQSAGAHRSGICRVEGIDPDLPRLTKPFRLDELAAKIADVIAG